MHTHEAIHLAKIFGPTLFIIGLWALCYCETVVKIWTSIKNNPAALYMGGVINVLIGFTILAGYNHWGWNLAMLVTLLGWVALIRGILILFAPQVMINWASSNINKCKWFAVVPLVWGFALSWFAYIG
jgi:hypothetical protein